MHILTTSNKWSILSTKHVGTLADVTPNNLIIKVSEYKLGDRQ